MLNNRSGQAILAVVAVVFLVVLLLLMTLLGVPFNVSMSIIGGVLVFIIAFVNTDLALIILIFSMLLSPEFTSGEVKGRAVKIRADDIFIIVIFFGWIAKMAINKELGLMRHTKLNAPIMIYIVACLLSSFVAMIEGRLNIRTSIFYLLKYIEYFLLFFLVANNLKTVAQAKKFVFYLLITCFVVSIYALTSPIGGRVSAPFESGGGGEPNTFAGYLVLMIPLIVGIICNSASWKSRGILLGLLATSVMALLYTLSRSGWASIFVVAAAFIFFNKKYRILFIAALLALAIILPAVAPKEVHQRIKDTFTPFSTYNVMGSKIRLDESGTARIDSWKIGIARWSKMPILGYGIPFRSIIDNQYMRVLDETGIIGFVAFMAILFTIFRVAYDVYTTMPYDPFAQALSIGFLSGFMGLLLFSSAAAVFIIIRIMEPFWFFVAIITVLPELEKDNSGEGAI